MSIATEFPEEESGSSPASAGAGAGAGKKRRGRGGDEGDRREISKWNIPARMSRFYHAVKLEMIKTTWPNRTEVWSTTVVVVIAVIFFGCYLSGLDYLFAAGFKYLEKVLK